MLCRVFPDVYSYDEDDMVLDSKLPEHLTHFGIDMMTMEKVSFDFEVSNFREQQQNCPCSLVLCSRCVFKNMQKELLTCLK